MCWLCEDGSLVNPHGDHRTITTSVLQDAADAAGVDVATAISRMVKNLGGTRRVVKSIETQFAAVNIVKAVAERRFTLGVAYPAMKADVATAADGHRDFVTPEALEQAAWNWMRKGANVGLFHQGGTDASGSVVESYIWRADPWVVKAADGSTATVHPGDWVVGIQWSDEAWPLVKSGQVRGFSPQGAARRGKPTAEKLAALRES